VLTSLLDDQSVLDMMTAPDGLLAGLPAAGVHLSTTTISPAASTRLSELHQEHGSHYVATNVLGRPTSAEAGELAALIAGDPEIIARCRPVLETFTNMIIEVGEHPAAAARMKLTINFFLSGILESMGEAYVFAEKQGLDTATLQHLMLDQVFPNPALREYAERIRTHYYDDAGATLITGLKDLSFILSEAAAVRAPLPIADIVRDNILKGLARGDDDLDWCVSTEANRIAAGLD
jgi:3-hydroxyisobutyrate dehydrogenase-like beta-hydroxyacid dehydrogenase